MHSNKNLSIEETFNRAIEYHKVKKIDLAKKFYDEVINKDPHHIHALNNLGIIFFSLKKFNEAIKIFQKTISV
jgi:Tfp pilus assembly protein PilF